MLRPITKQLICTFLIFTLLHSTLTIRFPADFKLCHRSDPEVNRCLQIAIEDAIPKLVKGVKWPRLPAIDPLKIFSVEIGEGTNVVRFTQKYKNALLHHMSDAVITNVKAKWDPRNLTLEMSSFVKQLVYDANFKIEGRVLIFPITGNGTSHIVLTNLTQTTWIKADQFKKPDGKNYMKILDVKVDTKVDGLDIRLDNLFNGNEILGKQINALLNDNWRFVYAEVRKGFEEVFAYIYTDYMNKIFSKIPSDELFLP